MKDGNTKITWKPIRSAPRNGQWFFARSACGKQIRCVHFDDPFDKYPISHDLAVWNTPPVEWVDMNIILDFLRDTPTVFGDSSVNNPEHPDYEPLCDISGLCEVSEEDEKSSVKEAMCIHCGGWRKRNHPTPGRWGVEY